MMKKLLFSMLLLLMMAIGAVAQDDVTIGELSSASSSYLPAYSLYNYSLTQQIYTSDEIGMAGTINSLSLWLKNSSSYARNLNVYMKEVDKSSFASGSDWESISSSDMVATATIANGVSNLQEVLFTLETPFQYSGAGNLLICIADVTGSWSSGLAGATASCSGNMAIYVYQDASAYNTENPGASGSITTSRNVVKLNITPGEAPACPRPTGLTVSNVTAHTATLSWTAGDSETAWQICLNDEEGNLIDVNTNPSYTFTTLTPETPYTVKVRANCGGTDGVSSWTSARSFTTTISCPAPVLTLAAYTTTSATLTWAAGEAGNWLLQYGTDNTFTENTELNLTEATAELTGLTPETIYYARVKAVCGVDDESAWSSTISFEPTAKIVIGSGTGTNSYLPTYIFYNYSLSQQIYTAAELGNTPGAILSVDFYSMGALSRNLNIYMVSTDKETFESTTDWIPVSASDLVYSGNVSFVANSWNTIDFDVPFNYDGTHNVAIIVDDNTGSYVSSIQCSVFDATSQAIHYHSDSDNQNPTAPTASGTIENVKNQIRLLIGEPPTCFKPTSLSVINITAHSAVVTWEAGADETAWQICVNDDTDEVIEVTDDPIYTLNNLDPESNYTVKIRSNCGEGDFSIWTANASFTTLIACPAPTNVSVNNATANSATISWAPGSGEDAWQICINGNEDDLVDVDANAYTMTGLTSDTDYIVKIRAVCGGDDGSSAWTANITVHTQVSCPAPTTLVASNVTATTATLTWAAGASEESWILQYGTDNTFADGSYTEVTMDATSIDLTGLTPETIYYARVKAVCSEDDMSRWTTVCSFNPSAAFTVGTAESTNGYLPTYSYYNYSLTQQIYTADEIGTSGTINSIDFYNAGSEKTRTFDLYVSMTDKSSFTGGNDWVAAETDNLVYSGTVTFTSSVWTRITFTTPLEYDGMSNLLVIFDDNTGSYSSGLSCNTFAAENQAIYYYNDSNNQDPTAPSASGTVTSVKNQIRLLIDNLPSCARPSALQASNITATSAELTWTPNGEETAWQICLNGDETNLIDATATSYTFANLTPETTYTVRVRAYCAADDQSVWSSMITFTTPPTCIMPSDLQVSNVGPRSAELTWNANGDEAAWQICINGDETNLIDVTTTNYTLTNLTTETTYTVKVRAYCADDDQSAWSSIVTFTTTEPCPAPQNVTVSNVTSSTATVSWTGVAEGYILRYRPAEAMATVTLTAGDIWGDGSGYQMLLDADATAYGTTIPTSGGLTSSGDVSDEVMAEFEYKIPENADGSLSTSNMVINNSVTIQIPAGTYDWCITNPTPGDRMWISAANGNVGGRYDDYEFEAGLTYEFTISMYGGNDGVDVTITGQRAGRASRDEDWIVVEDVTSPYTIEGLTLGQSYEVQVMSACGSDGESGWTNSRYFTTAPGNFTITATANGNGTITPSGAVSVPEGETQAFEIVANENSHITSVLVDGVEAINALVDGVYTFSNVTANHTITATFATTFTITATAGDNGSISPAGEIEVAAGDSQSFTITPNTGYQIASVIVDGSNVIANVVDGVYTFENVVVNHVIHATFSEVVTHTITATASEGGSISPSGDVVVNDGATQAFTITPDNGYRIASVTVDGNDVMDDIIDYTYTFVNVVADHTINVVFTDGNAVDEYTAGSLSVYPNPNNGMFSIDFSNIEGNATYQLIDARGAMIENRDINVMNGETKMFNHNLRPGTYFVRIINGDKVYVEQIVVE